MRQELGELLGGELFQGLLRAVDLVEQVVEEGHVEQFGLGVDRHGVVVVGEGG